MSSRRPHSVCTTLALALLAAISAREWRERLTSRDFVPRGCPHLSWRDAVCTYAAPCERVRPIPAAWTRRTRQCLYVHIPGHTDRAVMRLAAPAVRMYRRPLW